MQHILLVLLGNWFTLVNNQKNSHKRCQPVGPLGQWTSCFRVFKPSTK